MTNLRQAAQQALEALDRVMSHGSAVQEAKDILRAALAEPEQEPVAYCTLEQLAALKLTVPSSDKIALYTAPTPRRPLTNEEISAILDDTLEGGSFFDVALAAARAIERAHGIGEQT